MSGSCVHLHELACPSSTSFMIDMTITINITTGRVVGKPFVLVVSGWTWKNETTCGVAEAPFE